MTIGDIGSRLWFRPDVRGVHHVPTEGPVLVVGTRSGGRTNVERLVLEADLRRRGPGRTPIVTTTPDEVGQALDAGRVVLVQPSVAGDAHRPSWEPPTVDPDEAAPLLRPALDREVPIVPLVSIGGQETALFLTRGDTLARRLGLDRALGLHRLPVSLSLPWGVDLGGPGRVPFPAQVTLLVLPALDVRERYGADPDAWVVAHQLIASIRSAFDALAEGRRPPRPLPDGLPRAVRVLAGSGLVRPLRPDAVARAAWGLVRDGVGPAGAYEYSAALFPDDTAVIDDDRTLTFAELAGRISALAAALGEAGVGPGDRVGVLCRNHAGFVEATAAVSRLGADVLLLNTSFSGPQLAGVIEREHATSLVYDADLAPLLADLAPSLRRFVATPESAANDDPTFDDLVAGARGRRPPRATRQGAFVLLTSGTTGQPRGASRAAPHSPEPLVAFLSRIPLRQRDVVLVASPLFHAWGFGNLGFSMVLSSTLVLQRRFDPLATLAAIERHRVRVLVAVPVMLQRLADLPAEVRSRFDTSSLEIVASSGSALPGGLALRFMDAFGEVLHNLYGSTEVAWAAIATPADLRAAPGTAGRPPLGTEVRVVDEAGHDVEPGTVGRILVRSSLGIDDAATTAASDGLPPGTLASGDLGHFDELGRLYIDGRDDDMIVSGGENVYPVEVEDVLASHPAIAEVAVIGVPDPEFGERLKAVVVRRPGARLSAADVRAHVRGRLARFKVPRDVEFVAELPRNAAGKTLRRALRSDR